MEMATFLIERRNSYPVKKKELQRHQNNFTIYHDRKQDIYVFFCFFKYNKKKIKKGRDTLLDDRENDDTSTNDRRRLILFATKF